ncbi:RAD55 family ATPase [Candidatus Altiarchaeota archaeon]
MDDRCPTGIKGFDDLVEGGLPRNRTILVNGSCGTGKTVFVTQFLHNGAVHHDEKCVLVMLEQDADEFKEDMMGFNFDLQKLEDEGKLIIVNARLKQKDVNFMTLCSDTFDITPNKETVENIAEVIGEAAAKIGAKRAAIDSLSSLMISFDDESKLRRLILDLNYKLKKMGLTTLIISDEVAGDVTEAAEKYVVDGVISLRYLTTGPDAGRSLIIDKMRRTGHSENIHTLKFNKGEGIEILKE